MIQSSGTGIIGGMTGLSNWRFEAACGQMDADEADKVFFPRGSKRIAQAKEICGGCPVLLECRAFAMLHDLKGIWGGTTTDEREYIKEQAKPRRLRYGRVVNVSFG